MATGPKIPNTPLELLQNDGSREVPFLNHIWGPLIGGTTAFLSVLVGNWATRRPVMSGLQKHIALTLIGAAVGKYVDDNRTEYLAGRDAVLRHYVELHPDDFPPFERKKFSEVLEPWIPIR